MEEVLASIRKIIADEDTAKIPPREPAHAPSAAAAVAPLRTPTASAPISPAPPPAAPPAELASGVLDLTEAAAAPALAASGSQIDGHSDVGLEQSEWGPERPDAPPDLQVGTSRPLISAATSAAVDSAFHTLAHTVLMQNARTLDDLVREMLQPLLKSWLDDNLPGLVERLIRVEIERLSRGRG